MPHSCIGCSSSEIPDKCRLWFNWEIQTKHVYLHACAAPRHAVAPAAVLQRFLTNVVYFLLRNPNQTCKTTHAPRRCIGCSSSATTETNLLGSGKSQTKFINLPIPHSATYTCTAPFNWNSTNSQSVPKPLPDMHRCMYCTAPASYLYCPAHLPILTRPPTCTAPPTYLYCPARPLTCTAQPTYLYCPAHLPVLPRPPICSAPPTYLYCPAHLTVLPRPPTCTAQPTYLYCPALLPVLPAYLPELPRPPTCTARLPTWTATPTYLYCPASSAFSAYSGIVDEVQLLLLEGPALLPVLPRPPTCTAPPTYLNCHAHLPVLPRLLRILRIFWDSRRGPTPPAWGSCPALGPGPLIGSLPSARIQWNVSWFNKKKPYHFLCWSD